MTEKTPEGRPEGSAPPEKENILLNWILILLGLGAISLAAVWLKDFL